MASPNWLPIVIAAAVSMLIVIGVVVAALILMGIRSRSANAFGSGLPQTIGPAVQLRALSPTDKPISTSARWDGAELVVEATEWETKSLFDVPLNHCDQCLLTYCFRIKADRLSKAVYPELWCRIPERGKFFSRGLDRKIRQAGDWVEVELPFYLQSGQHADLLQLNLVFEGPGLVRMKDIEVRSTPVKAAV